MGAAADATLIILNILNLLGIAAVIVGLIMIVQKAQEEATKFVPLLEQKVVGFQDGLDRTLDSKIKTFQTGMGLTIGTVLDSKVKILKEEIDDLATDLKAQIKQ